MKENLNFSKIEDSAVASASVPPSLKTTEGRGETTAGKEAMADRREGVVGVAQEEARELQAKVESGEARDYMEAEKLVEGEEFEKFEEKIKNREMSERIELIKSELGKFFKFTIEKHYKESKELPEYRSFDFVKIPIDIKQYLKKYIDDNLDQQGVFGDILSSINYEDQIIEEDKKTSKVYSFPWLEEELKFMLWEYDNNIRDEYLRHYGKYFYLKNYRNREHKSFPGQVINDKPDVLFLAARKAVPWGIMYKEWAVTLQDELKKYGREDLVSKVPLPQFKLADFKLQSFEYSSKKEYDLAKERAISRYVKKLESVKEKIIRGTLKEPVKIAIFDEAVNMGTTLKYQDMIINQAVKKLGINAEIIRFKYLSEQPPRGVENPMHFIDEDSIAKRNPPAKSVKDLGTIITRLYEKSAYKLLQETGKYCAGSKEWIQRGYKNRDQSTEDAKNIWLNAWIKNIEK